MSSVDVEITPEPPADEQKAIIQALEELAEEEEVPSESGWRDAEPLPD